MTPLEATLVATLWPARRSARLARDMALAVGVAPFALRTVIRTLLGVGLVGAVRSRVVRLRGA